MIEIIYVWHDCFFIKTQSCAFVFDYWLDSDGRNSDNPSFLECVNPEMPFFVMVSHGHKDHYNPVIFKWTERFPNISFVVSRDVMKRIRHVVSPTSVYSGPKVDPSQVVELRPGQTQKFDNVEIAAFPSTDIGNSYIVLAGERKFFHAGDLNAWIWKEESTEQEIAKAMGDYRACLRDIEKWLRIYSAPDSEAPLTIDYCFFPVDSRIGIEYYTGAYEFVRKFDVGHFFPMHFALEDEDERLIRRRDALRFELYANPRQGEYIPLATPGDLYLDAKSTL